MNQNSNSTCCGVDDNTLETWKIFVLCVMLKWQSIFFICGAYIKIQCSHISSTDPSNSLWMRILKFKRYSVLRERLYAFCYCVAFSIISNKWNNLNEQLIQVYRTFEPIVHWAVASGAISNLLSFNEIMRFVIKIYR